jgi:hypothetical protein
MRKLTSGLLLSLLSACAMQPELAAYPDAAPQIRRFYEQRAWELNATCTDPRIQTITAGTVVEDTPERLVLAVRYRYEPFNQTMEYGILSCKDWGERNFTFRKVDGTLQLESMSGEQRRTR